MYRRSYYNSRYTNPLYGGYIRTTKPYPGIYKRPAKNVYRVPKRYNGRITDGRVKRVIGSMAEKKYLDTLQSGFIVGAYYSSGMVCASNVTQGTGDINRIGDKLTLNSIQYKFVVTPNIVTGGANMFSIYRLIIFKWYDDTTPTWGDVLQNVGTPYEIAVLSPLDHDRKIKRKILVDNTIKAMQGTTSTGTSNTIMTYPVVFEGFIDLKKKPMKVRQINFTGGSTNGVGHIYFGIICADWNENATTPTWANGAGQCSHFVRINYIDV